MSQDVALFGFQRVRSQIEFLALQPRAAGPTPVTCTIYAEGLLRVTSVHLVALCVAGFGGLSLCVVVSWAVSGAGCQIVVVERVVRVIVVGVGWGDIAVVRVGVAWRARILRRLHQGSSISHNDHHRGC